MNLNYGNINFIMKKLLLTTILLLFLSGCATTAGYQQVMQTWIGSTETELIRSRGTPNSTYASGGSKFLEYSQSRTTSKSYYSSYNFDSYGGSGYSYPVGGGTYSCKTTYEIKNGVIADIRWVGNSCKAEEEGEVKDIKPVNVKKTNKQLYDDYVF